MKTRLIRSAVFRGVGILTVVPALLFFPSNIPGQTLGSGQGVGFSQVNYNWATDSDPNSTTGQIDVNANTVLTTVGASSGYLNVSTSDGWVIQNLPVINGMSDFSADFLLPVSDGTADSSLNAAVQFSTAPLTSFTATPSTPFSVGSASFDGEGDGAAPGAGTVGAPSANSVSFNLAGLTSLTLQLGHPNIQAARNQCAPASFANNLQWLKTTYGLAIPNANTLGLAGDNTLVGKLDTSMLRAVTSRTVGGGVGRLAQIQGLLQYLSNAGLGGVTVKNAGTVGNNVTVGTMTTQGKGALTFGFILNEIQAGDAVQASETFANGGGHSIEITGAGSIFGANWITYESDHLQTDVDPTDTLGVNQVDFSFLDGSLDLLNEGGAPQLQFAVAEAIPEPSSLALAGLAALALAAAAARRRSRAVRLCQTS